MLLNCGVGEDSWESQDSKIKAINPKGDQSWIFIGRTDAEAEALILCPPDAKSRKRTCCWERLKAGGKGPTEDTMVGWHHWLYGHGFGWTLGVGDGQGGLACYGSWGYKELDTTEGLNWTELNSHPYMTTGKSIALTRWTFVSKVMFLFFKYAV